MATIIRISQPRRRAIRPLRVVVVCLVISALFFLWMCQGCAAQTVSPHCVPLSILNAWTWGVKTGNEVRIGICRIDERTDHAQAEAKIDGRWTPLTEVWTGNGLEIRPWTYHYGEPYRYLSLREWINEQIIYTEGKP